MLEAGSVYNWTLSGRRWASLRVAGHGSKVSLEEGCGVRLGELCGQSQSLHSFTVHYDNRRALVKVKRQVLGNFPTEYQYIKSILIDCDRHVRG